MLRFCGASGTERHSDEWGRSWPFPRHPPPGDTGMGINTDKSCILPATPLSPPALPHRHPSPGPTRTGDVEHNGALGAHANPGEGHPTGEVGAVVLRAGCEQDLRGVRGLQVQSRGSEGSPCPGDGEGHRPITGPWHRACQVAGAAGLQGLLDPDIRGLCQRWRGEKERPDPRGDPRVCL